MSIETVEMDNETKTEATKILEEGYEEAEKILEDEDKIRKFLKDLEEKIKTMPALGEQIAVLPTLISLIYDYIKQDYTTIPLGSIIAIVSALAYVLSPIDLIPDAIPVAGLIDDGVIVAACLSLVQADVNEYRKWRDGTKEKVEHKTENNEEKTDNVE